MFDFHSPFEKLDSKVWLSSPTMHGEELKYVTEAYETNWMSTVGENINEVERMVAEKIGVKHYVVEQDTCPGDPFDSLKISRDYIKAKYM